MPKLFLILSATDGLRCHNNYWREASRQFSDEYDIHIIETGKVKDDYQLIDDVSVKISQLTEILSIFSKKTISDDDVFLFTDAWNFGAIPLAYLRKSMGINAKCIGFWGNSFFNGTSFNAKSFYNTKKQGTGWAKNFEKGLLQTYDLNLFASESLAIQFRVRYFPLMVWNPVYLCPFPFDYIRKATEVEWKKEDVILVPFEPSRPCEYEMIEELKHEYPGFKFCYASQFRMSRETYLQYLQSAKILLVTPKLKYLDPTVVWEAMNYGVIPLLPSSSGLTQLGYEYRYPAEVFGGTKVLHFIRR